ncbi:EcsC family protein [Bacillus sp. 2205SS5-2]|uniref:EcsC family protein n=1 Tax=Bacillus sp. 2205SS5-2 TaxID=3109031 RepID=UPI0030078079
MSLSEREERILGELERWEENLYDHETNDLENTYDKWIESTFSALPLEITEKIFKNLDGFLFHLHSLLQGSQMQNDARESILSTARAFHEDIETIEDLRYLAIDQLHYIAEQHAGRHRVYSFLQGGITGTGGFVALGSDFPAMAVLNLRSIQLISMSYGYDVQTPYEMMTSLKVFHVATLPKRLKGYGWEGLVEDLNQNEKYFFDGQETFTDYSWLEGPLKQLTKGVAISLFRKKKWSGLPLLSMAIGAGANYQLSRKVTDFAERYYQYRYLNEKKELLNQSTD